MKKIDKKELHEIFSNLKNKDQAAYNKLYEHYYNLVYGITFSILKHKEDCEDVTQEIFTKIYKMNVQTLPVNNEASWLFTVSKNECYTHLRKVKPNINIEEIYEIPSSYNELEKIVDTEYYNDLISRLKEEEKLIVSLKVLSGFSFKKISQIMCIPIGTVQWKYYKAINSLKVSISSLVGAIIAFVIVLVKGNLFKKEEYFSAELKENEKEIENTDENTKSEVNNIQTDNFEASESIVNSEKLENNDLKEKPSRTEQIELSRTDEKMPEINPVGITFTVIGITLILFFIIFFKKYQQKLKRKKSK